MDFPLIYCNGCSYSNSLFHPDLNGKVHADYVGETLNGFVLNKSISGSNNRRIIRTSLHDIIHQRQLNPNQKIIVFISLTFEIRSDLWVDDLTADYPEESQFVTHQFSVFTDWQERLLLGKPIDTSWSRKYTPQPKLIQSDMLRSKFSTHLNKAKAFFFSPYAERINLLTDLLMFTAACKQYNINYLIFQAPVAQQLDDEYLLDFFKDQIAKDLRIFNLETFGFLNWAHEQKFIPLDSLDNPTIGHYNSDAHKAFADQVLIPKLKETKQI